MSVLPIITLLSRSQLQVSNYSHTYVSIDVKSHTVALISISLPHSRTLAYTASHICEAKCITQCAFLHPSCLWHSLCFPRTNGQTGLAWLAGYTPRWFSCLMTFGVHGIKWFVCCRETFVDLNSAANFLDHYYY